MRETIYFIVGATSTGKSKLAESLYDQYGGSIVNFDSIQFYKGMDIGSAKPSKEERSLRPHFLFDHVEIGSNYTAADFRRDALSLLKDESFKFPAIFVGGSGFYLSALENGFIDVPKLSEKQETEMEEFFSSKTLLELYEILKSKDPLWAEKIKPQDTYRVKRALLILSVIDGTITELHEAAQKKKSVLADYKIVKLGIKSSRAELEPLVKARCKRMLEQGFIEEYQGLVKALDGKNWQPLNSVGYREIGLYLSGELSQDNLLNEMVKNTLRLAKRQRTWFRRDKETTWLAMGSNAVNL